LPSRPVKVMTTTDLRAAAVTSSTDLAGDLSSSAARRPQGDRSSAKTTGARGRSDDMSCLRISFPGERRDRARSRSRLNNHRVPLMVAVAARQRKAIPAHFDACVGRPRRLGWRRRPEEVMPMARRMRKDKYGLGKSAAPFAALTEEVLARC